jgi:DNA-binding winged helix-turn-helix (wHTH) protein
LRYWIDQYASRLINPNLLQTLLSRANEKLTESELKDIVSRFYNQQSLLHVKNARLDPLIRCLEALRTEPALPPTVTVDSPSRAMGAFVHLVVDLLSRGPTVCQSVCLLVDGVDEYALTQNDPRASAELLQPLLGNLRFLELPYLVTKFFLPVEYYTTFESVARTDRLEVIHLNWDTSGSEETDGLRTLLRRRIAAFNTRGLTTLAELCHPSLRRLLEDDLLKMAHDSPRNLLRLGDLLFSEHCRETPAPGSELLPVEWDRAVERFRATVPDQTEVSNLAKPSTALSAESLTGIPQLRVDTRFKRVYRGSEEIDFASADLEYRLIEYLYQHRGEICTKDEISLAVYEPKYSRSRVKNFSGVSNQAIDRLFNRLRQRIELKPSQPIYVITLKGRGYRLDNTV